MELRPVSEIDDKLKLNTEEGEQIDVGVNDADTVYTDAGLHKRIVGYDAAEVGKITETGGYFAGSRLGAAQTQVFPELMREYGFDKEAKLGKDVFGRDLINITNDKGENLSSFLVEQGIVLPTKYTSNDDMARLSFQRMRTSMFGPSENATPVERARDVVESLLSEGEMVARPMANTVEEYQDYTSATSNMGLASQEDNIKRLMSRLELPELTDEQRRTTEIQLQNAKQSFQTNLNLPKNLYLASIEGLSNSDNYSKKGRALDLGLIAVKENAKNILEYLGDAFDSDSMVDYAKDWEKDLKRESRVVDLNAGDRDITGGTITNWDDVEADATKIFDFVGNSILAYGPQMATMITGSLAGGIVAGPAGASVVPMLMGIGDVYGEMPDDEKSVSVATAAGVAIGLIDKFGFSKGAIKASDLMTKEGLNSVAKKLSFTNNIPLESAKQVLHKSIKDLGSDYAKVVLMTTRKQLLAKKGITQLVKEITKSGGKESATEAVQEAIQYSTIAGTTTVEFNYEDFYKRIKESAIVGGVLGSAMSLPKDFYGRSDYNRQINIFGGIDSKTLTNVARKEQAARKRNNGKIDDLQLAARLRGWSSKKGAKGLKDLMQPNQKKPGVFKSIGEALKNGTFFSSTRDNVVRDYFDYVGGEEIASLIDAPMSRGIIGGLSPFKRYHQLANYVASLLPADATKRKLFNTINNKEIGARVLSSIRNGTGDASSNAYRSELNKVSNELIEQLVALKHNEGWVLNALQTDKDFFINNMLVDTNLVRANTTEFVDAVMATNSNLDRNQINDLANRISDNMTMKEITELRDLGLLKSTAINKYKTTDIENNAARMIELISRSAVRNATFGANGENLAAGVQKMLDAKQITPEQASDLAANLVDLMSAWDGELRQIETPFIKGAQENAAFIATMVYMDTSLFANLAEIFTGSIGLSKGDMVKYFGKTSKNFVMDVYAKITQLGSKITGDRIKSRREEDVVGEDYDVLTKVTGHYGKTSDIGYNVGANINSQSKRNMSKLMFKFNLIESATNSVRAARGAFAVDEFNNLLSIIAESPKENEYTQWARDRLNYYRMDVDTLLEVYYAAGNTIDLDSIIPGSVMGDKLIAQLKSGVTNFIDEFSSRPEPGSTAKVFDDNRFNLFTQFQKFTWHFTSNVIPQLWKMYIRRGPPEYTYSAFAALATSFLMAYAGMHLKAAMRGDEEEEERKSFEEKALKAFNYSIGQAPMDVIDKLFNVVETNPDGSFKRDIIDNVIGQSPSLSLFKNTGKDIYKIATREDDERNKSNLIRRIPVFGEIPAVRDYYKRD